MIHNTKISWETGAHSVIAGSNDESSRARTGRGPELTTVGSTVHRVGFSSCIDLFSSISVEIIPGTGDEWLPEETEPHKRFLVVENNLGVPQKVLYKAYLEATAVFRCCRTKLLSIRGSLTQTSCQERDLIDSTLNATAVLIVLNPGHSTAWNARKNLILSGHRDILRELSFTTSLLTVRECAKHSLLWHHRRWLLRRIHPPSSKRPRSLVAGAPSVHFPEATDEDTLRSVNIPLEALEAEFSACTVACGTYERNYFGWSHRFRCLDALVSMFGGALVAENQVAGAIETLQEEWRRTTAWINRHVSDYTAMQYQCHVDGVLQHPSYWSRTSKQSCPEGTSFDHAKSLLKAYPSHEAIWLYLRGGAQALDDGGMEKLKQTAEEFLSGINEPKATASLVGDAELQEAQRHAQRLLSWITGSISRSGIS